MSVKPLCFLASLLLAFWSVTDVQAATPRLVVVVSVDQWCQAYFERFADNLSEDGLFQRMQREGAIYTNCHHAHAFTLTGPGHAALLTGAHPRQHGIIGNDWYDRATGKGLYCVTDKDHTTIGVAAGDGPCSPKTLLVPTLGDGLKQATGNQAKVFGVALKDRAAILMTGHHADAAFWFEESEGVWATSSYYRKDLPGYVRTFNEQKFADRYAEARWTLLLDKAKYHSPTPDDFAAENPPEGLGRTFPHQLGPAGKKLYSQLRYTPLGNDMTLALARDVLVYEKLGQDDVPDMLCVNLSSNDYVGHAYGPDSLEVEDMTYRTDRQLAAFVEFIDEHMAGQPWCFALTSDHGVCPLPEYRKQQGLSGGRDPLGSLSAVADQLEKLLRAKFELTAKDNVKLMEKVEANQLYLNAKHPQLAGERLAAAQRICRDWLAAQKHVHAVFTREELLAEKPAGALEEAMRKTFHPQRSGDVLWVYEPYYLCGGKGTTHGSPWDYDSHVPLWFWGAGVQPGAYKTRVSPAAIAPTLAKLLQVQPPAGCVEAPLLEAIQGK